MMMMILLYIFFLSFPAYFSMALHCCSNHSCLSFLADVLVSLHNFLYFLFVSSDTFLFSFALLFSFASTNFVSEIHSLLGRSTVGTTSSTASINIALIVFTFSSIFEPFISVCLTLRDTLLSYLSFMFLIFSDPMSRLFLYCL